MKGYHDTMAELIEALAKLPGFGRRSAERVVFYLLKSKPEEAARLSSLIQDLKAKTGFCKICHHYTDAEICSICSDPARDAGLICVVEDPKDVIAIEKTGSYNGLYHVLLGVLSPLDGVGPEQISVQDLIIRLKKGGVRELILATNPNTEGDITALYLGDLLKKTGIRVSRLARGVPVGSHIEYADQATLSRALEGRLAVEV